MARALARPRPYRRIPAYVRLAPKTSYGLIPIPESRMIVIDRDADVPLPMPPTFEVRRASALPYRGHFYFRLADDIAESEVPHTFEGGEVRVAASGYVIGPGCRHASGDVYESNGAEIGVADRELIDYLREHPATRWSETQGYGAVEAAAGTRHAYLSGQARKFAGWGYDSDEIEAELLKINEERCVPPLTGNGLKDIVRMAAWAAANVEPDAEWTVAR